ncbi:Phosphatidylglycerol/phosphatidylinositol transfer protein [Entomophthora muscae]|uniref:Phosphatidylglycerol/phosphatidylinositol transfer protein n=1 Tax=Entomophthora muscae TaxID=34485 RepID=A0ACC2TKI8_9FUNG|nr:Phosphatidylglycerol/phosphatidylinositol transfer protein [Entomophthora muscae]
MKIIKFLASFFATKSDAPTKTYRTLAGGLVRDYGVPNDIFQLHDLYFEQKPRVGSPVNMHFTGQLYRSVSWNSKMFVKLDYNGTNLINLTESICELATDLETGCSCPISPQRFNMRVSIPIPFILPPGDYKFHLRGQSDQKEHIFKASVHLKLGAQ